MALMMGLAKLSPEATKGLVEQGPVARAKYFQQAIEESGGKVLGYYLAEGGEWDVVTLAEMGDAHVGAGGVATLLSTAATGLWARNLTIRLYTPEEVEAVLGTATTLRLPGSSD